VASLALLIYQSYIAYFLEQIKDDAAEMLHQLKKILYVFDKMRTQMHELSDHSNPQSLISRLRSIAPPGGIVDTLMRNRAAQLAITSGSEAGYSAAMSTVPIKNAQAAFREWTASPAGDVCKEALMAEIHGRKWRDAAFQCDGKPCTGAAKNHHATLCGFWKFRIANKIVSDALQDHLLKACPDFSKLIESYKKIIEKIEDSFPEDQEQWQVDLLKGMRYTKTGLDVLNAALGLGGMATGGMESAHLASDAKKMSDVATMGKGFSDAVDTTLQIKGNMEHLQNIDKGANFFKSVAQSFSS